MFRAGRRPRREPRGGCRDHRGRDGRQVAVEVAVGEHDTERRPQGEQQRADQQHPTDRVLALGLPLAARGRNVRCGTRHTCHDSVHNLRPGSPAPASLRDALVARVVTVVRFRTNSPALGVMGKDGALSPRKSARQPEVPRTVSQSLRLTLTATAGLLVLALLAATAAGGKPPTSGAGRCTRRRRARWRRRRTQRPGLPDRRHAQGRPELPPQRAQPAGRRGHDVHAGAVAAPVVLPGASRADDRAVRPEQRRAPQLRPVRRLAGLRPVVHHRDVGPGRRLRDRAPRQAPQPLRDRRSRRCRVDELRHPARAGDRLRELHVLRR